MSIRARVTDGRLVIDEPVYLPEGTVLDLVIDDEADNLDDDERAVLHRQLKASHQQALNGQTRPAIDLIAELRSPR